MSYSESKTFKKIRRRNRRKQFIAWFIVLFIMVSIITVVVSGIVHLASCMNVKVSAATYGVINVEMLTGELPAEWISSVEVDFVPLDVPMDEETQKFVYYLSQGYNIDFPFVMALIDTESGFDANEVSATNDFGLMQINKINHDYLADAVGVTDFLDPHQNICAGMFMLKNLFEKYNDPESVLMAYNLGEGGAARLWEQGIYETNYSNKVLKKTIEYKEVCMKGGCK